MAIQVNCDGCGRQFRAKDEIRNARVRCPNCKAAVVVAGPHVCGTDVFISHSTADKQVADAVCAAMESKNLKCWIAPRDIPAGASWGGAIIEGIEDSRVMLLIFSEHTNKSVQVLREVERAVGKRKPVVPLRLDATPMGKDYEYFLASCHWLDATNGALEDHLATLTTRVRNLALDRAEADADVKAPSQPPSQTAVVADESLTLPPTTAAAPTGRRAVLVGAAVVVMAIVAGLVGYNVWRGSGAGEASADATTQTAQPAGDAGGSDLLAKVQIPDDVISGVLTRTPEGGLHVAGPAPGRVRFGQPPGGDYNVQMEITPLVGTDAVGIILSRFGQNFVFVMGGERGGEYAFTRKRKESGGNAGGRPVPAAVGVFRNDVRHTITVKVRRQSVLAIVDGMRVREMRTDYQDVMMPDNWGVGRNSLGLITYRSAIVHKAECVPVAEGSDDAP